MLILVVRNKACTHKYPQIFDAEQSFMNSSHFFQVVESSKVKIIFLKKTLDVRSLRYLLLISTFTNPTGLESTWHAPYWVLTWPQEKSPFPYVWRSGIWHPRCTLSLAPLLPHINLRKWVIKDDSKSLKPERNMVDFSLEFLLHNFILKFNHKGATFHVNLWTEAFPILYNGNLLLIINIRVTNQMMLGDVRETKYKKRMSKMK
jgi:hypothetical protein